jgi:hypothetical protein
MNRRGTRGNHKGTIGHIGNKDGGILPWSYELFLVLLVEFGLLYVNIHFILFFVRFGGS